MPWLMEDSHALGGGDKYHLFLISVFLDTDAFILNIHLLTTTYFRSFFEVVLAKQGFE